MAAPMPMPQACLDSMPPPFLHRHPSPILEYETILTLTFTCRGATIHRAAESDCLINSWRAYRPWCTAGERGQHGTSLPPYTRSRDPKIGPTSIYQTVSEEIFSETQLDFPPPRQGRELEGAKVCNAA